MRKIATFLGKNKARIIDCDAHLDHFRENSRVTLYFLLIHFQIRTYAIPTQIVTK